ncbi:MAG: hypothetical protein ACKO5K_17335 [Armatimonadota bacterium]
MARSTMRTETAQQLSLLAFGFSLAISGIVLWPAFEGRARAMASLELARAERAQVEREPGPPELPYVAAEVADPEEPPRFLGLCRRLVAESGCTLVSFDLAEGSKPKDGETVWPVRGKLEVEGPYRAVRDLAQRLTRAPRMMAVGQVEIYRNIAEADNGRVQARFETQRYVTRRDVVPSAPAPETSAAGTAKDPEASAGL